MDTLWKWGSMLVVALAVRAVVADVSTTDVSKADVASERMLRKEVIVNAPLEAVWKAWTAPEGLSSFWPQKANIELRPGGAYEFLLDREPDREGWSGGKGCKVLSFVPQEMLSFEWSFPPSIESLRYSRAKTQVVLRFDALGESVTRVRFVQLGWQQGDDWNEGYAYFDKAWDWVLGQLKEKLSRQGGASETDDEQSEKVLALLRSLVGGEWIHEGTAPDGDVFRVLNNLESGPDGASIVGRSWLGGEEGMVPHGATQIWREPVSGEIRFQSINEVGELARGEVILANASTLVWEWNVLGAVGHAKRFRIEMDIQGKDRYSMKMFGVDRGGDAHEVMTIVFERVAEAPERFRHLKGPTRASAD